MNEQISPQLQRMFDERRELEEVQKLMYFSRMQRLRIATHNMIEFKTKEDIREYVEARRAFDALNPDVKWEN